jgi:DNA-directed RNA polymerase I subunit RPA2
MLSMKPDSTPDIDIGHYMINRYILIHLGKYGDKLECLLLLLRKLYSFAAGDCGIDNADSLQNQEILMPGHLICSFVKEKFEEMFMAVRLGFQKEMRLNFAKIAGNIQDSSTVSKMVDRYGQLTGGGIGKKVQHFLSTGNIISSSGLDLMQVSGYTIVAERLNFLRYCAHFRSVHRGQFFMEMKTTAVRKLLPDQWGFLCPVHTPDGGPCGLLSHLALKSIPLTSPAPLTGEGLQNLDDLLVKLGVAPCGAGGVSGDGKFASIHNHIPVCLDGRVVGGAHAKRCKSIMSQLRHMKVGDEPAIPPTLEIALIPPGKHKIIASSKSRSQFSIYTNSIINSRRYQGWSLSRIVSFHRNSATCAPSVKQSHRENRNDWSYGTTFHGYCVPCRRCQGGNYNASRAGSH